MTISGFFGLGEGMPPNDLARRRAVWAEGNIIPLHDPAVWRADAFGALICGAYGRRDNPHGWEIDHIVATRLGGGDHVDNLRPLHFRLNAGLGALLGAALR